MSIKTIIAVSLLSLGTTTAALAEPWQRGTGRYDPRARQGWTQQVDRDLVIPRIDRVSKFSVYDGPVGAVHSRQQGFVALTKPTRIAIGREHFDLSNSGFIDSIQLQAVSGTTSITQVGVGYADGRTEQFQVNQRIDPRRTPAVTLDLKGRGRQILWINVNGESYRGSAYQILASAHDDRRTYDDDDWRNRRDDRRWDRRY